MYKILLVEDEDVIVRLIGRIFTSDKYEVVRAANGKEGLEKLGEYTPDIVLLDLMMPEMNGAQFLEKVKADEKLKNIPVVILTNLAGKADTSYAQKLGAQEFWIKSKHEPSELLEMVNKILKK